MKIYRTLIYSFLGILFFFVLVFGIVLAYQSSKQSLTVTFFDVGQGDAILIAEGSYQVLIDGGRNGQLILERLGYAIPFWDRTLEAVVATHPDQDHIGGLIDVIDTYTVENILTTQVTNDSEIYGQWKYMTQNIETIDTYKGLTITFPSGAVLETLYPHNSLDQQSDQNTNDASIVMQLTYNDVTFLFTGDLGAEGERELQIDEVDVLKVGHHGSKTSSDEEFISKADPEYAIISAGENNRYGHPAPEVMTRLRDSGARVLETSKEGTIQYVCKKDSDACDVRTF